MGFVDLMIARVEPLTRARAVRGPFDYRLTPQHQQVQVGSLLRIPFGGRLVVGVVVALAAESALPSERLAEPEAVLPSTLPSDLVALAGWMAQEYCSTPARALSLLLAPGAVRGARPREVLVAVLTQAGRDALVQTLGEGGRMVQTLGEGGRRPTESQRMVLAQLAREGPLAAAALGHQAVRRLEARGLLTLRSDVLRRRPAAHSVGSASAFSPSLTPEQRTVLDRVLASLAQAPPSHGGTRLLIQGVTGSGKTEVYLQAVAATLAAGRGAIVLVPEIALTPQALGRFRARFGDAVAVLHSALSQGERGDEWRRLRSGDARVCVGPRSAVFAPIQDIGLVIIDEEHESSYKHEGDPRYDARTVAARRASEHGAVLLAGSATPRPESVHVFERLRLRQRIDGRALPPVEVLDMRGHQHPLHPETRLALGDVRRAGQKAIVLLNRRGWSNFLSCRSCGRVWMCPDCEVALVLHRAQGLLACHHCGHRERAPVRCGECGSSSVARHGAGTERIEHDLTEALGDRSFPVFRLDADATAVKHRAARTLEAFHDAGAGILIGTQMVAKGHDFPDVTLGIVLDADQTLRFPDFRSEERTFALLTQLAGRAGRGEAGGRVLVQTIAPEARSIRFAARHDADGFLDDELIRRRALSYPPFSSLIRIVCSAPKASDALTVANALRERIAAPSATVLGPAPLFRLRGRSRSQLVIKAINRETAIQAVGAAVDERSRSAPRPGAGVNISVDVDPS